MKRDMIFIQSIRLRGDGDPAEYHTKNVKKN